MTNPTICQCNHDVTMILNKKMQCYSMMIITECLLDAIMAKVDVIVVIQPTFCLTPYVVFQKPT
jgi:hypothetical protein